MKEKGKKKEKVEKVSKQNQTKTSNGKITQEPNYWISDPIPPHVNTAKEPWYQCTTQPALFRTWNSVL